MDTHFDLDKILESGRIDSELQFERALIADRRLKKLAIQNPEYRTKRNKLRDVIENYENTHWSDSDTITPDQIEESDFAEIIAEKERVFFETRKNIIRSMLKHYNLTQQNLGSILGHNSKSYTSEIINGVKPLSMRDIVIIHKVLNIRYEDLIPPYLTYADIQGIKTSIKKLGNDRLKLEETDLELL